jgi:hypothetical protein
MRGSGEAPEMGEGVRREKMGACSPGSTELSGKLPERGGFRREIALVLRRNSWWRRKEAREGVYGYL